MVQVTLQQSDASGSTASADHFGANMNFIFQENDVVQNVAQTLNAPTLRYPGGSYSENPDLFDFRAPNRDTTLNTGNTGTSEQGVIPMDTFLASCQANGIQPVIIIPSSQIAETYIGGAGNERMRWDPSAADDLADFVKSIMDQMGSVGVHAFEIGNEYQSFPQMGANGYGNIANGASKIIQDAIDEWMVENTLGDSAQEPSILVQANAQMQHGGDFGVSGDGAGPYQYGLDTANQTVLNQFDADGLAAIDGVVSHFYFKDGMHESYNLSYAHNYQNMQNAMAHLFDQFDVWDASTTQALDFHISEWNVSHGSAIDGGTYYTGMAQTAALLEMLSQSMLNGTDSMQAWAMQSNPMALATPGGDPSNVNLTLAGQFMALTQEKIVGKTALDIGYSNANLDVHGFSDGDSVVFFVSSLGLNQATANLDMRQILAGIDGTFVGYSGIVTTRLDPTNTDGVYAVGNNNNPNSPENQWETYFEPDADLGQTTVTLNSNMDGTLNFQLDDYGMMMIELTLNAPATTRGVGTADEVFTGTHLSEKINTKGGADTVYAGGGNDSVIGSGGNDHLFGDQGNDTLNAGGNNDRAAGGQGDDSLLGGAGNDTLTVERAFMPIPWVAARATIRFGVVRAVMFSSLGRTTERHLCPRRM